MDNLSIDFIYKSEKYPGWLSVRADRIRIDHITSVSYRDDLVDEKMHRNYGNVKISLVSGKEYEYHVDLAAQAHLLAKYIMDLIVDVKDENKQ